MPLCDIVHDSKLLYTSAEPESDLKYKPPPLFP